MKYSSSFLGVPLRIVKNFLESTKMEVGSRSEGYCLPTPGVDVLCAGFYLLQESLE